MLYEEAKCHNMWVKKNALHVAETVPLSFVAYSTRDHNAEALVDHLNHFTEHRIQNRNTELAKFGAELKMIWDGASEDVRIKWLEKENSNLRAIHIIGPKQGEGRARKVLKAFLLPVLVLRIAQQCTIQSDPFLPQERNVKLHDELQGSCAKA